MIDTNAKLEVFLSKLSAAKWAAIDTEADSLHAYPEKLCLIQISIEGEDVLVDSLSKMDFASFLSNLRQHELILHGADYDLRLLRKTFDFVPTAIFDTMTASRFLGAREFGLGNLVAHYLGVTLEKGPQKADWARRPLTSRMETYARNDTRYLKPLADILRAELKAKGRLTWHQETCSRLIQECAVIRAQDADLVWRVKGSHVLSPPALAVLRQIWEWREKEATGANRPPFFILPPETMVNLAIAAVENRSCRGLLPRRFSVRRERSLAQAIQYGLARPEKPERLQSRNERPTEVQKRRFHEFEKRRNRWAEELGIDPTLIASRATLIQLAKDGEVALEELTEWQRELLQ